MAHKIFSDADEGDGWVVARQVDGKIQIAVDNSENSYHFDTSIDAWTTLHCATTPQDQDKKHPRTDISNDSNYEKFPGTPIFLIRDLLNFKKINSFSDYFLGYGKLVDLVTVCGRITEVSDKDYHQRLILDDGTSAILVLVKKSFDATNLDETQYKDEIVTSEIRSERHNSGDNNDPCSILLAALEDRIKELDEYARNDVFHQQHSLGIPVRVKGRLNEFMGKNYIFCYHIKQIPEKEYFKQLNHTILVYKFGLGK